MQIKYCHRSNLQAYPWRHTPLLHVFIDYQICGPISFSIISGPIHQGHKLGGKGPCVEGEIKPSTLTYYYKVTSPPHSLVLGKPL